MIRAQESQHQLPLLKPNFSKAIVSLIKEAIGSSQGKMEAHDEHKYNTTPMKCKHLSSSATGDDSLAPFLKSSERQKPSLHINALNLCQKDFGNVESEPSMSDSPCTTIKVRCRIAISELGLDGCRMLHCESQICTIATSKDVNSSCSFSRIDLPSAFEVPQDCLFVYRTKDSSYGLADSYKLSVDLEPVSTASWPPPLGLYSRTESSDARSAEGLFRPWIMSSSCSSYRLEVFQQSAPIMFHIASEDGHSVPCAAGEKTEYRVTIDLCWSSQTNRENQPQTTPASQTEHPHLSPKEKKNEKEKTEDTQVTESDIEAPEPVRTLRIRDIDRDYNIKSLSDQARGIHKRRKVKIANKSNDVTVRYYFPSNMPIAMEGLCCLVCGNNSLSLELLQFHLQSAHPGHKYKLELDSLGPHFHISSQAPSEKLKEFAVQRAFTPLDSSSPLINDQTLALYHSEVVSKSEVVVSSQTGNTHINYNPKTRWMKAKSLTDSAHILLSVDKTGVEMADPAKITIPNSHQKFYHPVSRQLLNPGDELPEATTDMSWFRHKHRQGLNELENLTPEELEYIKEFDSTVGVRDIGARRYFPRAWLDFVKTKADWLVEAKHRIIEFSLHQSYLVASGLLKDEHVQEAVKYIEQARQARSEDKEVGEPQVPARLPATRKSKNGCGVCQMPVLVGPQLVMCTNKACETCLFHTDCLSNPPVKKSISTWLCDSCVHDKRDYP